jgi:uncharacterized protein (DUF302 family)
MPDQSNGDKEGIVTKASPYPSVLETLRRLREAVRGKGLDVFALIDHSGAARRIGLVMQEAKLLLFSSLKAGTPLMVTSPLLVLNLPLKILIWRNRDSEVLVSYNATSYLPRHDVPLGPRREHCGHRRAPSRRSRGGLRSHGAGR